MNKFFVNKEVYKERLDICRSCIKASIGSMSCPLNYWTKTKEVEEPKEIPKHLLKELKEVWVHIENKQATNHEWKARAVELYNAIHNTKHKTGTNCSSCLQQIWTGLSNIINKNK